MEIDPVAFQIVLVPVSAITGAAALLWLQTKYLRVKLLQGMQQEMKENIRAIGEAGIKVYDSGNVDSVKEFRYSDDVFQTIRIQAPILYSELVSENSSFSDTYKPISNLSDLGSLDSIQESQEFVLKYLENTEGALIESFETVKEVRNSSWLYRLYFSLFIEEVEPHRYGVVKVDDDELKEVDWRPSEQDGSNSKS